MMLKIYEMAHSPYCIPITRALESLKVDFERVAVPNWDRGEVIRVTGGSYYQVPVLLHGDEVVYESGDRSLDIAGYVDRTFAGGRLFPAEFSGIQEILVEFIENELEGATFKLCDIHYVPAIKDPVGRVMVLRHKERRFGRGCLDRWREEEASLQKEVDRMLGRFDSRLKSSDYLLGGTAPAYVDFALLGVIENYTFGGQYDLSSAQKALSAWRDRLLAFRFPQGA